MARVLVISPHMDDEVLGCGGTIARHVDAGDTVDVVVVCHRVYGRKFDAAANEIEKTAARKAKDILGYAGLHFLDLPDERLYAHFQELLEALEKTVARIKPDVVYVCHAHDLHQDHRTVAHACNIVFRSISAPYAKRVLAYEVPSGTDQVFPGTMDPFTPSVFVDISPQLDRKVKALAAYERESRAFPHPRSPEALRSRAQMRGAQCLRPAAEAFVMLRETV